MKNQKGIASIIFIIIIIALLAVAGFFAYKYFSAQKANNQPINQTAGWKTYTNSQYGFEFKYPQGWNITINKHIENPEQVGVEQIEVNFPPEKEISNYEFSQGYAIVVQIQKIKDLDSKTQDQLYASQLRAAGQYGFNVLKFDFQGQKGVAMYQYTPANSSSGEGCMTSIAVFHKDYLFNMEPVFGDVIASRELGKCSGNNVLHVSDEYRKVISTFKFTK